MSAIPVDLAEAKGSVAASVVDLSLSWITGKSARAREALFREIDRTSGQLGKRGLRVPKTDDKGKRKAAESSGQRPEVQIAHRVAKATGSTEVEIEIPVGVRAVVARMKANGRPWSLAVINQGVGKAGVLRALYELEDRAEGAVIAVFPEDACMEVYGRHLPHPDVLKLCITRFKGLIVDGVLMRKPRKKKPWLDVDWDDPRLNPIVAAITDGRIPPPEEDDPVESFAALVEKRPPIMTEQKRKRFLKSAEKAMPFFSEKHLW